MSFGFSVGDFITVIDRANKIRKDFVDAPSQFKDISNEVRGLAIVLSDVEVVLSNREFRDGQKAELEQIVIGCKDVLDQLERTLDKYKDLKSSQDSAGSTMKRVWKRLKWEPEDIKQLRSRISTNIALLNAFTSGLTRDDVATLVHRQKDEGRQKILDWITPIDYALQQSDFIGRRQAGTGQWLLESAEFKAWVETEKQTLFCPGIPGAGKTILASIVVEELSTRFENNADVGIAYLYCNYKRKHEQSVEDLFCSLVKQLVQEQPLIPDCVTTLYDRHANSRTRPSVVEILGVLQIVVSRYSRVFIITDALDECQVPNRCRQIFISSLRELQLKSGANLFATSRIISSITKEFKKDTTLEIRASEEDVRKYLEGHMLRLPGFVVRNTELQEEIVASIVKAVDGMFLLAQLHLESLTGKRSPKAVRTALKNLAVGSGAYDDAYNDAMERIRGQLKDQEELAIQVLSWLTCAMRPLTVVELQTALAVELGETELDPENLSEDEDMISACAGLVTVDDESGIIRLVHYTTQEYFERTQERWFPHAQIDITKICTTYLSFGEFHWTPGITELGKNSMDVYKIQRQLTKKTEQIFLMNKLYDYASVYWGDHARNASGLIPEVLTFLEKNAQVRVSSFWLYNNANYLLRCHHTFDPWSTTGLCLAVYFGIEPVIKFLLKEGNSATTIWYSDIYGNSLLHIAAWAGHVEVVKLLLGAGADAQKENKVLEGPIAGAIENGHVEIVKLLLELSTWQRRDR